MIYRWAPVLLLLNFQEQLKIRQCCEVLWREIRAVLLSNQNWIRHRGTVDAVQFHYWSYEFTPCPHRFLWWQLLFSPLRKTSQNHSACRWCHAFLTVVTLLPFVFCFSTPANIVWHVGRGKTCVYARLCEALGSKEELASEPVSSTGSSWPQARLTWNAHRSQVMCLKHVCHMHTQKCSRNSTWRHSHSEAYSALSWKQHTSTRR